MQPTLTYRLHVWISSKADDNTQILNVADPLNEGIVLELAPGYVLQAD